METFYRDMAELSVDGLWVVDLDGNTRYANPAVAAMFGLPREEFIELSVFDTLDELGKEQFAEHLAEVRQGHVNPEPVDVYFVRHDGTALWTLVSEQLLRDEDDQVVGILHRLSLNEERRRRVEELTESRRRLAEAEQIARLGSFRFDLATMSVDVSDSMAEVYGLDSSEPMSAEAWAELVHPDDRERLQAAMGRILDEGGDFDLLVRVQGPGAWIWTRARGYARTDDEGRVTGLSGTLQDVTAHKLTEQALEQQIARDALVRAVATACTEARSLGEALELLRESVRARREWATVRAYVPTEHAEDVTPLGGIAHEPDPRDQALALAALRANLAMWDSSGTVVAAPLHYGDGVHAVFTLTATTVPERSDEVLETVRDAAGLLTRVVEREEAERRLAAARDDAVRASNAKSEFLAVMSHEIRTPLNGVIGLNELMLKTSLERRQRQLSRGIRDAGRSLLRLVNDVLDLSKIEAGHLELETVDFEVREICDRAAELVGDAARRKGVELAVACDPGVPEVLAGDPTRVTQVLGNLVSNAVKFTEAGHVLVNVTSHRIGRRVRLTFEVTDTGQGIAPDAIDRIFDDFAQADLSTTRVHGGTGLGLSISRHIARALDGELTVVSTLGEGSTFTFTAMLDVPRGARTCPDDDVARARLSGGRVLVVSDSASRADVLRDQLSLWRTRIDWVEDGEAASAAVRGATAEEDPYDAVVVDVPAAQPHEISRTAELLHLVGEEPAFLLLTQRPDAAVVWAMREPSVQVLTKPVSNAALRDALLGVDEDGPTVSATTAAFVRGDRPRVLVVEDNQVNQLVATGMLESLGYEFDLVEDGVEAVERFDPELYDAVLMDVQMPRMDGYDATRLMRERDDEESRTPIIAMTAAAVEGERERCLASGMDDYLTKPVELNKLGAALMRWLPAGPPSLAAAGDEAATTADPAIPSAVLDRLSTRVPPKPRATLGSTAVEAAGIEAAGAFVTPRSDAGGAPEHAGAGDEDRAAEPSRDRAADRSGEAALRSVLDASRLDALLEMGPRAEVYLAKAVSNFLAGHLEMLDSIRVAAATADLEALEHAAHKLAGSALNLGLTEVGVAARAVELCHESGCPEASYAPLVAELETAVARAVPALQAYRDARGDLSPA